jgi:macrodomain Ter protein organizer (MatP/YcbG family)
MVEKKSIVVSKDTWERLMRLKVDMGKRTINEVIKYLIEEAAAC